jgi:SpoIID/LytB domain protein
MPTRRGASGRIMQLTITGEHDSYTTGPELAIRRLFDPPLKSSAFSIETVGAAARPSKFILHGAGSGHGVGMCQTGAMGMANAGKSFREILKHYYPKADLLQLYK